MIGVLGGSLTDDDFLALNRSRVVRECDLAKY